MTTTGDHIQVKPTLFSFAFRPSRFYLHFYFFFPLLNALRPIICPEHRNRFATLRANNVRQAMIWESRWYRIGHVSERYWHENWIPKTGNKTQVKQWDDGNGVGCIITFFFVWINFRAFNDNEQYTRARVEPMDWHSAIWQFIHNCSSVNSNHKLSINGAEVWLSKVMRMHYWVFAQFFCQSFSHFR